MQRQGIVLSWFCKLALDLVNQKLIFHTNAVPWAYALSRHCTGCLCRDCFHIERISLKSKTHGNEEVIDTVLQRIAPLMCQNENACVILTVYFLDISTRCFTKRSTSSLSML